MNNLKIEDMSENEKPCEKMLSTGPESLSDAELLAIIIRTGNRNMNAINLAQSVLNYHNVYKGIPGLNYLSLKDMMSIPGIGKVKSCQLMAVIELSKRISESTFKPNIRYDSPESVADYFMERLRFLTKERVYAVFVSASYAILSDVLVSEGTIDKSILSPREIFLEALKVDASGVILIHNHPSGNPEPSDADIVISLKIQDLGKQLGIKLIDHIIIGDKIYISLHERGLI